MSIKWSVCLTSGALRWIIAAALSLDLCLQAAQTPAGTTARALAAAKPGSAPTNAAPAKIEPAKSVFVIPTTAEEGRDPFFPQSTRLHPVIRVAATNAPAAITDLELKGISGAADRLLAIINNRTFGRGEEGEIICNAGRVRILCVDITPDSARIVVNGQERTLHFHSRF